MKPNETLLLLFHFICGSFLEQKATEYECLLMWQIKIMLDLPTLTFCSRHVYKMASKLLEWKRAFLEYLRNWTLALSRTLDFGDHEWYEIARVRGHCSLKRDVLRAKKENRERENCDGVNKHLISTQWLVEKASKNPRES